MPIANFAVSRRVTVAMIATAIVVLGIFAFPRLPIDLLPSFQPPIVAVTVNYGNVAPDIMESTVTRPIENAVARVSGIDYLQSNSFQGQTVVRAVFKYGTDINVASTDIQNQIARISSQLPNDPNLQQPQIVKADPNAAPVVFIYITDPTRTQRNLNDLVTNSLSDEFASIAGVGSATASGGQSRAIMIEPDQVALAANGLSDSDVISKISSENVDDPAGLIAIGPREYGIRTRSLYTSAGEVADTVVAIRNAAPIYLRDVARVTDSIQEQRTFARMSGRPAVKLNVTAQPDANVVAVANGVYAKIAELQHRYPTMHFNVVFDQRDFISQAVDALEHTAILGAVLAVLIILLFLHSWRSTLIVAVSLPVSALGTLFATYITHQSLNTMTLGGLALAVGLIVDDAVVVTENIFRHLDAGEAPLEAARNATAQIFSAVLSSTATVVTVFVPLLLIPGLQGLIFGPFALTVMCGVAISFVVAVTTVPMLSSILLRRNESLSAGGFAAWFDRRYDRFERFYRRALGWSLDRPGIILGCGALLFVATVVALRSGAVATEVFPPSDSRFARFDLRAPNGTSLAETNALSRLVEDAFATDPRVVYVGATVGASFGGNVQRQITNQTSLNVTLAPGVAGERAAAFVREWERRLGAQPHHDGGEAQAADQDAFPPDSPYAQLSASERARAQTRFRGLRAALVGTTVFGRTIDILQQQITQGADDLTIQLYGPDYTQLYALAQAIIPHLAQVPGIGQPDTNVTPSQPEIDVKIDRRKAAQYGFSTGQVAAAVATTTSGTIASYFQQDGIQYPIVVEAPPVQRRTFATLGRMPITPPVAGGTLSTATSGLSANGAGSGGGTPVTTTAATERSAPSLASIPLGAVATLVQTVGPSQISRQNKQRRIDIDAPVDGRPLGDAVADAARVMDAYPFPSRYRWQFGPSITQNNDTFGALALVVILAIALIYMLLASQFESFLDPLVIMMAVPFALVGIVLSLLVTHRSFGLTAFIGSLMLVGIAVKNAILVIEFTKQLRRGGMDVRDALVHAGPLRLRPILMTTFATVGGMLPLALGIEAGSATQAPLGTVVIGGLVTSTLLSLLVVPTLYLWVVRNVESRWSAKPPSLRRRDDPVTATASVPAQS